jgi:hypothetical protein
MKCEYFNELLPVANNLMKKLEALGYQTSLSEKDCKYFLRVDIDRSGTQFCSVNIYYAPKKGSFSLVINGSISQSEKDLLIDLFEKIKNDSVVTDDLLENGS